MLIFGNTSFFPGLVTIAPPLPPPGICFYTDRSGNFYVDRSGNFYIARECPGNFYVDRSGNDYTNRLGNNYVTR